MSTMTTPAVSYETWHSCEHGVERWAATHEHAAPERVRLAAIDARGPECTAAATCTQLALRHGTLDDAFAAANRLTHQLNTPHTTERTRVACVAADITTNGHELVADAVVTGDAQLWVLGAAGWELCSGGPNLTSDAYQRWRTWRRNHPNATAQQRAHAERDLCGATDDRVRAVLGDNTEIGQYTTAHVRGTAIVVATSGSGLRRSDMNTTKGFMARLRRSHINYAICAASTGS